MDTLVNELAATGIAATIWVALIGIVLLINKFTDK